MPFKFRLQSYLNVKEKIEEQRKLEYSKAIAKLEEEKMKMDFLIKQKSDTINNFKSSLEMRINPQLYNDYNNYIEALKKEIEIQNSLVKKAEAFVEERRKALVEAVKERKILDKLKENKKIDYTKEEILKDAKLVDEIVSYKFNR